MRQWSAAGDLSAFDHRALHAYWQSCNEPARIHAFCEDYRAGATRDIEADEADLAAGKTIQCPTYVIWSDFISSAAPSATASSRSRSGAGASPPRPPASA